MMISVSEQMSQWAGSSSDVTGGDPADSAARERSSAGECNLVRGRALQTHTCAPSGPPPQRARGCPVSPGPAVRVSLGSWRLCHCEPAALGGGWFRRQSPVGWITRWQIYVENWSETLSDWRPLAGRPAGVAGAPRPAGCALSTADVCWGWGAGTEERGVWNMQTRGRLPHPLSAYVALLVSDDGGAHTQLQRQEPLGGRGAESRSRRFCFPPVCAEAPQALPLSLSGPAGA